jgi:osmotically inducible protein OsmC
MDPLYTTSATSFGPRRGRVASSDGRLDLELAPPPELGGNGAGTNPEQLFAAGYAACFHAAVARVAKQQGLSARGGEVSAQVSLGPGPGEGFALAVRLSVHLPEVTAEQAGDLVRRAHEVCPYSNATRGNVEVGLAVSDSASIIGGAR